MIDLYLMGLFTILAGEYGYQPSRNALTDFKAPWRRRGLLFRAAAWAAFWWLGGSLGSLASVPFLLSAVAGGEAGALLLRRAVRVSMRGGHPHGSLHSHFLPIVFCLYFPLIGHLGTIFGLGAELPGLGIEGTRALGFITAVTAQFCWGTLVTLSVLDSARSDQPEGDAPAPRMGAGEVIGIVERLVILLLVTAGGLSGVGFVVAAKTVARFRQFRDQSSAEYFIIGTLTSAGLSTLVGLILRQGAF